MFLNILSDTVIISSYSAASKDAACFERSQNRLKKLIISQPRKRVGEKERWWWPFQRTLKDQIPNSMAKQNFIRYAEVAPPGPVSGYGIGSGEPE